MPPGLIHSRQVAVFAHEGTENGPSPWIMGKSHPSLGVGACMTHLSILGFSFNWSGDAKMVGILDLNHSLDQPQGC